jgi:2,4-dienoyl-CoA reductase-like NADH-dependent reductase (Old Yellow Enzyme family)
VSESNELFSAIRLRSLEAPNRLWVSPMCQYSSVDGFAAPWHVVHLGSFAIGRAGLIVTEATAVSPEGRISKHDVGIWSDEHAEAWRPAVEFTTSQGVPLVIQLAHAGRKASSRPRSEGGGALPGESGGWQTVAPSDLAFGELPAPHALTLEEIAQVRQDFVDAALRAVRVGFAGLELHAAHGYLIDEFLSPLSNERTDAYGGSFENRCRLLIELVDDLRAVLPDDYPLFVRLSAVDWVDGGWDIEDTVRLCLELEQHGVDFLDISSGGNDPRQKIAVGPGYQMRFARAVRAAVSIPVGCVGLITTPQQAAGALLDGAADVALVGRQFLRKPTFALRAAAELGQELEWPRQYSLAKFRGSIP